MTSTPYDALRRLRELAARGQLSTLCERHDITLLVVHGSALDAEPLRPARDLDIAFQARHGAAYDVVALTNDLIEAAAFEAVDVMDLRRANSVARARALAPGSLVLHEAESGVFARAQMAALTTAMETRHLRRLDLELLAG
ncbi:MAG: hypothetical protein GEV04_04160 [Actinophytocola sp.]|nr:hypothetical protein [Actinophytocola sp.]